MERVAWRTISDENHGYGASRAWRRHSFSLEAIKMLFNYHGFVPFVGPGISVNGLRYEQSEAEATSSWSETVVTPELVFGWDIRPTKADWFILRTNLRWSPLLELEKAGVLTSFRAVEFNFIQLVIYPQRIAVLRPFT